MAHSYSHLYGMPTTGLRYFMVFGPGVGRTYRLAVHLGLLESRTIDVFNHGKMQRALSCLQHR